MMIWWILGVLALWLLLRAAMRTGQQPPSPSPRDFIDGSSPHPGLTLPFATLDLAVSARHPGEQIFARFPAWILARSEQPVQAGELALGSSRIHWTSYTASGLGISGGFAFAFQEILAIRTRACNIDFYVDQNALGEDGLVTRFSFRVEPDNSLIAAFFTQFSQQYERVAARAFQNYDDEDLARVPVLDWSEQITFRA